MYSILSLYIFLLILSILYFLYKPENLYKKIYIAIVVKINLITLLYFLFFFGHDKYKKEQLHHHLLSESINFNLKADNGTYS
ncbi:hypothetical protein Trichorick_00175 [Candidatus Trichorickettsia mobilis]|uniref:Uncharacterized protein n=1 Tax=Candidatus Trichorickettsia mobilis TaxID=1346319 RepID=A0ABZ0UQI4_9RICK|nr:hypothetical protein Trichorick_00175 [Candidatus Trichorickettsia mobilis]